MNLKKSGSLKYITALSAVICAAIVLFSLSASLLLKKSEHDAETIITEQNLDAAFSRAKAVYAALSREEFKTSVDCENALRRILATDETALSAILFMRTADEHFFRAAKIMRFNAGREISIAPGSEVREGSEGNLIRRGVYEALPDETLYSAADARWFNIFGPVKINAKEASVQISYSAAGINAFSEKLTQSYISTRKLFTIAAILFSAISFILVIFQLNSMTLFMKELTGVVKDAARGTTSVRINPESDSDISELALSFNSLIGEIKEKEKLIAEMSAKDSFGDLFKFGVNLLKESRFEDALSVFNALIAIKGESFGSCFNAGIIYAKMKRYGESLHMLEKALELNPGHELTRSYLEKIRKALENG